MIAFDLEIARCIPSPDYSVWEDESGDLRDEPGYRYCNGWTDFAGMGISVITTFSMIHRMPRIFLADNFDEFLAYVHGQTLVGFNNDPFDNEVLQAAFASEPEVIQITSLDLLQYIRAAAGEPATHTPGVTRSGRRLGGLAGLNGVPYLGNGRIVDAPREWQDGNKGVVIDYCMRDTMMLAGLLDRAASQGYLRDSATGQQAWLPHPFTQYGPEAAAELNRLVRPAALDYIAP